MSPLHLLVYLMAAWCAAALAMAPLIGRAIARGVGFRDLSVVAGQRAGAAGQRPGGRWALEGRPMDRPLDRAMDRMAAGRHGRDTDPT